MSTALPHLMRSLLCPHIPGGFYLFHMEFIWLRAQPFWHMLPCSFHMETPWNLNIPWNISLEYRWNEYGIHHNSFHGFHIIPDGFHIIPHGFHIISYRFHIDSRWIAYYSRWIPHYSRWIPYYSR